VARGQRETEYAEIALGCQGQSPQKGLYGTFFPLPWWEGIKGRGDLRGLWDSLQKGLYGDQGLWFNKNLVDT
jgi:hypothetical protein